VPARPDLWEAVLALYLPGGELLLHRSFGAGPDSSAASSGPLSFRCVEPLRRWSVRLDGTMRRTSTAEVTAAPLADGPWQPVRFEADFEGLAPAWSARGLGEQEWADGHLEQPGRITGSAELDGRRVTFATAGFRDHSYGPRDYAKILGDVWVSGVFPSGRTLLAIVVWTRGYRGAAVRGRFRGRRERPAAGDRPARAPARRRGRHAHRVHGGARHGGRHRAHRGRDEAPHQTTPWTTRSA